MFGATWFVSCFWHSRPQNPPELIGEPLWNQGDSSSMDRIIPYELVSESGDWKYEDNRCQIREHESKVWCAQGSVLGPILLTLFTCPLCQICAKHVLYHLYADDQQIYLIFQTRAYWDTVSSRWLYSPDREMPWGDQKLDGHECVETKWWQNRVHFLNSSTT